MARSLTIITPYPQDDSPYSSTQSALASFAFNKVQNLIKLHPDLHINVLADFEDKASTSNSSNITIYRIWKRNSFKSYIKLFSQVQKNKDKDVLIEMEWALFGKNPLLILPLPFFIAALRLTDHRTYLVSHGVSLDFSSLAPQLGINPKSILSQFLNLGLNIFYALLTFFSTKIITLEQQLADQINQHLHTNKAYFIPHGVDTNLNAPSLSISRKKLHLPQDYFIIINFGFLSWYKGSDLIVKSFSKLIKKHPSQKIMLIMAGGESQAHKDNPVYQKYISSIKNTITKHPQIIHTGFVANSDIPLYYSAADLVVLPYRQFISSSGPLSLAFTFKKPAVLSSKLQNYVLSPDFGSSLEQSNLKSPDITFHLTSPSLLRKINWSKKHLDQLRKFSILMNHKRGWPNVSQIYYQLIFGHD